MTIRFMTAEEVNNPLPISIGLSGGSGTGKTYSALLLAKGIADAKAGKENAPIAFVDTENRRGLHYLRTFPQIGAHYIDFGPTDEKGKMVGYPPERWMELLDYVEASDAGALVIDSFSHAWEGISGVLDLHAEVLERLSGGDQKKAERVSQLAWANVKPRYRRLINRIIRSSVDTIICTRAKPVMQKPDYQGGGNARATKTRRGDVPWDPAADADLIFEMTAMVILDPASPGAPRYQIKVADQFKSLFREDRPLSVETGRAMAEWSLGRGSAQQEKALMDAARAAARGGKASLQAHWKTLSESQRMTVNTIMEELKRTAVEAESAAVVSDDPFAAEEAEAERHRREAEEMAEQAAREMQAGQAA